MIDNSLKEIISSKITKNDFELALTKRFLFVFNFLNSSQLEKLFNKKDKELLFDSNSKKHLSKIYSMILSFFNNEITLRYLDFFFYPISLQNSIQTRLNALNNFKDQNIDSIDLSFLKKFNKLDTSCFFSTRLYTIDYELVEYFYSKYKINLIYITQEEIALLTESAENDFILVTNEDVIIQTHTFNSTDFENIVVGKIILNNKELILSLLKTYFMFDKELKDKIIKSFDIKYNLNINENIIDLFYDQSVESCNIIKKLLSDIDNQIIEINQNIKKVILEKKISIEGNELLELFDSSNSDILKKKISSDVRDIICEYEKNIINNFKENGITIHYLFSDYNYPVSIDLEIIDNIKNNLNYIETERKLNYYKKLGKSMSYENIYALCDFTFIIDMLFGILKFRNNYSLDCNLKYENSIVFDNGLNLYLKSPVPIKYALKSSLFGLNFEKVAILTGANSGGKTTLLEMIIQATILTHMGIGINATGKNNIFCVFDEIIYLKKFTGNLGSGAFEQTLRSLVEIMNNTNKKMILIDEFEAITEPGAAAKILIGFLTNLVETNDYCVAVSHLGKEIDAYMKTKNIKNIRIDGICASGLDEKSNLITNHQPEFYVLGKSTPELIVQKILMDEKFWVNINPKLKEILNNIKDLK